MTTNIFDSSASIMATDSRWSITYGPWLMYVDDVGYDKIEVRNGKALMFAGLGKVIQQWKDWIRSDPKDASSMPPYKGMAVCMVDVATKVVDFQAKQDIIANGAYCAGSGALPAYACWMSNRCVRKAVETAKSVDFCSGGEVKFFSFLDGSNNLKYPMAAVTIDMVDRAIAQGGHVMKMEIRSNQNTPFASPIAANSGNDEAPIDEIRKKISSGELSANAPCNGMHNDWSDEDKETFKKALGKMFSWNS